MTTTRRALCRVVFVAAEAASRFQGEAVPHDPVGWMMAPRRLFGGFGEDDDELEVFTVGPAGAGDIEEPRLFSATVWFGGEDGVLHCFHASVAGRVRERVGLMFGADALAHASMSEGVDANCRHVQALVAPAVLEFSLTHVRERQICAHDIRCHPLPAVLIRRHNKFLHALAP